MLIDCAPERQKKAAIHGRWRGAAPMEQPPFETMALPVDGALRARAPRPDEIGPMLALAAAAIGAPLASVEAVGAVAAHDPESVWLFERAGHAVGTFAMLHLNAAGVAALEAGRLDLRAPPVGALAEPSERPAGIYFWAMFARGRAAAGVATVFQRLRTGRYRGVDLYALPYTADGRRFADRLGFEPLNAAGCAGLMRCARAPRPKEMAA
jgi:hypothetical protein